jgi:outer membrane lipoprotein-sorting protein
VGGEGVAMPAWSHYANSYFKGYWFLTRSILSLLVLAAAGFAQQATQTASTAPSGPHPQAIDKAKPSSSEQTKPASDAELKKILELMDRTAANFRTTQASFVWDQYQRVVNDTDIQKGILYFKRSGDRIEMAADITDPDKKYVLFSGDKVRMYQPKIDQVTEYDTGKRRAEFESFLVLGFGGSGEDMVKSFDVIYAGEEKIGGSNTVKLDLVPKSDKVKKTFQHIVLWIDPKLGISVQQQFFEPSGDYRLAKYSDIQLNGKIADSVFKLKTTSKTKTVSPQG